LVSGKRNILVWGGGEEGKKNVVGKRKTRSSGSKKAKRTRKKKKGGTWECLEKPRPLPLGGKRSLGKKKKEPK